jgi:hypothetical protein
VCRRGHPRAARLGPAPCAPPFLPQDPPRLGKDDAAGLDKEEAPRLRHSQERARRKKMSRAQDDILKYIAQDDAISRKLRGR